MEVKGRLKLVAKKVPQCTVVCDVGTDHAYVPIYLVKKGVCQKAILADVREGPIKIAKKNAAFYKVEDFIETRIGYGLDVLNKGDCEVVVIAGMGGILIKDILTKGFEVAKDVKTLIIQPMNAIFEVRKWLIENGFDIFDEELLEDDNKIYNVICARWNGVVTKVDEIYCYIGLKLFENHDSLLRKLILKEIEKLDKATNEMKKMVDKSSDIRESYLNLRFKLYNMLDCIKD